MRNQKKHSIYREAGEARGDTPLCSELFKSTENRLGGAHEVPIFVLAPNVRKGREREAVPLVWTVVTQMGKITVRTSSVFGQNPPRVSECSTRAKP